MKNQRTVNDSFFNKFKYVFLAGGAAAILMTLVYYCFDLVPFGDMTILRMDLYHQYGPLFAELYDRLTSNGSLLYSFESGLGGNFLGNFLNYLSSPLSFIVLFFGHKNITEAISVLIFLKAVLSAMTFAFYLKQSHHRNDASVAAFGILYAFCGYFVAYYWNLMWIDAMYIFPIVIYGIEKIIQKGKPITYCLALAIAFFANYYMAYMICIFSILYFLTYYFSHFEFTKKFNPEVSETKNIFKKLKNSVFFCSGIQFAVFSIIGVLLVAAFILPLMEVLSGSSATNGTFPTELKKYFTAFDFLANHIAYSSPTIRSSGADVLPNVYCGILTLLLVPLYFFCNAISKREKIANVLLLGVLYFSFNLNFLNYFWHGFHFPNDLPYRFSFMYSFVLLQMAYKSFLHIRSFSGKQILGVGIGVVAFLVLVEELQSKNITDISLLVSLLFTVGYVFILYAFTKKQYAVTALSFLLLCTSVSEIAISDTNQFTMNQNKPNYTSDYESFRALKEKMDEQAKTPFYRMELTNLRTRMDPSWYNYNGVSVFSSMANEKVANLQSQVGLSGNFINSYTYHLQTPIYNAMFGLEYIVDNENGTLNSKIYTPLFTSDKFTAYKNNYGLPIAFGTDATLMNWHASDYDNPFEAQNEWFKLATATTEDPLLNIPISNVVSNNVTSFLPNDISSGKLTFSKLDENMDASFTVYLEPVNNQNIYLYVQSTKTEDAEIFANMYSKTISTHDGYILDLGMHPSGETITVEIPIKKDESRGTVQVYAYTLSPRIFEDGYNKLQQNAIKIEEFKDTNIKGTVFMQDNQILYTSIPFDKNWEITIDGAPLFEENIIKISDALLAVKVGPGTHEIEFKYVSKGLILGSAISLGTLLFLLLYFIIQHKNKKKVTKWAGLTSDIPSNDPITDDMVSAYLDLDVVVEEKKKE